MRVNNKEAMVIKFNQFYNNFLYKVEGLSDDITDNPMSIDIEPLKRIIGQFHVKLNYMQINSSSILLAYLLRRQLVNIKKIKSIVKKRYKRLNKLLTLHLLPIDLCYNMILDNKKCMYLKTKEELKASDDYTFCRWRVIEYHMLLTVLNSELEFLRKKMNSYIQQTSISLRISITRPHSIVRPSLEEHKEEYLATCIEYARCHNVIDNKK